MAYLKPPVQLTLSSSKMNSQTYFPLDPADSIFIDVTEAAWPSYRRSSQRMGGDWAANFSLDTESGWNRDQLETLFFNGLGRHFEETYQGHTTFQGFVNTLRLTTKDLAFVMSFDTMTNSLLVAHQSLAGNSFPALGGESYTEDYGSISLYGRKQKIFNAEEPISTTAAADLAAIYLAAFGFPKPISVDIPPLSIGSFPDRMQLDFEVHGYVRKLNWVVYTAASVLSTTVGEEVPDILTAIDTDIKPVKPGIFVANAAVTNQQSNRRPVGDRIFELLQFGNTAGGCYQGVSFSMISSPNSSWTGSLTDDVQYTRFADGPRKGIWKGQTPVHEATILPMGRMEFGDFMPRQSADVKMGANSFAGLSAQIDGLEFSPSGLGIKTIADPLETLKATRSRVWWEMRVSNWRRRQVVQFTPDAT